MQVSDPKSQEVKKTEWENLPEVDDIKNVAPSDEYFSVCDIWKDNVHKIITKIEYQTPIYLQAYTQVHSEFLHCVDNLFGTCYIWQKQYFDKLGIDQKIVNAYGKLYQSWTNEAIQSMDVYANYKKFQADVIVDAMKIGNNYLHWWIDTFGKTVSFWTSQFRKTV
jgi:hypothetical protein